MKITLVKSYPDEIQLTIIDLEKRRYAFAVDTMIEVHTDCGVYRAHAKAGTETDGRSGSKPVDLLIPNVGNKRYRRAPLFHDLCYAFAAYCEKNGMVAPISFETANEMFRLMAILPKRLGGGGVSKWRMRLAKAGVDSYFGRKAYEEIDKSDRANFGKIKITWDAK